MCWNGETEWCCRWKNLGIWRFSERINLGLVSLVGCYLNELHGVTRDGENNNFGDNCWDPGSNCVNMSYSLPNLESGDVREGWGFILIWCIGGERDISWGKKRRVHVELVCDTYIRGGCCDTRKTWGRRHTWDLPVLHYHEIMVIYP